MECNKRTIGSTADKTLIAITHIVQLENLAASEPNKENQEA